MDSETFATDLLIETADGVLSGHSLVRTTHCRVERGGRCDRAALSHRGVAVSRGMCQGQSHVQDVRMARSRCEGGVQGTYYMKLVRTISGRSTPGYKNTAVLEFKKREVEQQVEIL